MVMENIEPFTDIWYKDCFFHALFPMIKYFNKEYRIFFENDIYSYTYDSNKFYLHYKEIDGINMEDKLESIGIRIYKELPRKNIIEKIINELNKNRIIILNVDRNIIRKDKASNFSQAACHSVLVYGYDEDEKYLNILENRYYNSTLFEKQKVSYSSFKKAYESFVINFSNEFKEGMLVFSNESTDNISLGDCYNTMKDKLLKYQNEKINSLNEIDKFIVDFNKKVSDREGLHHYLEHLMKMCNRIIINKNIEMYVLKVFKFENCIKNFELYNLVTEKWKHIRTILYIYQLKNNYQSIEFARISKILIDIKELEVKLNQK